MQVEIRPWKHQRSKTEGTRSVTFVVETEAGVGTVALPLPAELRDDKDAPYHEALRAFAAAVVEYADTKPPRVWQG